MPRAWGFDGDSAYQESLEAHVRAGEAKRRDSEAAAKSERRASMGLPEEEPKSWNERRKEKNADPARKKSIGEKAANLFFNAGRSSKAEKWGRERVGMADGEIKKISNDERVQDGQDFEVRRSNNGGDRGDGVTGLAGHGKAEVIH